MDYAVSRYGRQVLTIRPAMAGFKDLGGGFKLPHTDPGVHIKFQKLEEPFETPALPMKYGKSAANGFLNLDEEVNRLGDALGEDDFYARKKRLIEILRKHPENVNNGGVGFALFVEGETEITFTDEDIFEAQPDGTNLIYCKVCDMNVQAGLGLASHKRGRPHKDAFEAYIKAAENPAQEAAS